MIQLLILLLIFSVKNNRVVLDKIGMTNPVV